MEGTMGASFQTGRDGVWWSTAQYCVLWVQAAQAFPVLFSPSHVCPSSNPPHLSRFCHCWLPAATAFSAVFYTGITATLLVQSGFTSLYYSLNQDFSMPQSVYKVGMCGPTLRPCDLPTLPHFSSLFLSAYAVSSTHNPNTLYRYTTHHHFYHPPPLTPLTHPPLAGTQAHARAHTTLPLPQSGPTDLLLSLRRVPGANPREKGLPGSAGPSWARLGESRLFSVAPKAGTQAQGPRLPSACRAIAA